MCVSSGSGQVDECLDDNGTTLLMAAAYRGLEGVVRECLANMADVRKANTYGNTGLHFCIAKVRPHEDSGKDVASLWKEGW